ncbi:MAG TPA: hypothetical protein VIT64_05255, partial [Ilumatobacteraceae bacterium]
NRSDVPVVSSDTDTETDGATPSATTPPATTPPATTSPATTSPATTASGSNAATPVPSSVWGAIAGDPRGAVLYPSVVWTGSEALVVGGLDRTGASVGGAAGYDPATDTWRRLADPPNGARRINALTAWTGAEMLVIGGDNPDGSLLVSYGEAYDPELDTWRYTASPPIGFVSDRSPAVWTGHELLVWPWDGGGPTMPITPIAYDPITDTWRELPQPPVERRQRAASVWTGTEWVVWGGTTGELELADGAAYDPDTDTWRVIAEAPLSARRVRSVWTGSEMIVQAGSSGGDRVTGNGEFAHADGAAYDPATDTWRQLISGAAHPGNVPVWTGRFVLVFAKGGAAVYDVAADRWLDGDCCPGSAPGGGVGTPVWAGTQALLLGSDAPDVGGATFTPPASP